MCVRERERESARVCESVCACVCVCVYLVCVRERVCVCVRERERESARVCESVCACVCVCVHVSLSESHQARVWFRGTEVLMKFLSRLIILIMKDRVPLSRECESTCL